MAVAEPIREEKEALVEEIYYRKGDIDFCFLLNRHHHNLRVFDYRVGNYQQKRDFFDRIARSEGLRKVFTVVEKQDSKSWRSVGFSREGAIPGYFRTADAYVMSRVYTEDGDPIQGGAPKLNTPAPTLKPKAAAAASTATAAAASTNGKPRGTNFDLVRDPGKLEAVTLRLADRATYAPFRRGMFHPDLGLCAKMGRREVWVGAETDSSFGHAKVDLLTVPDKDTDLSVIKFALASLLDELIKIDTASVFSLVPADWALGNQIYADAGFKVTARLTDHIVRDDEFVGAQLWHRRVATTAAPRLPSFI